MNKALLPFLFILKIFLFLISAIVAGYTIMDVKPEVLEIMTYPVVQFLLNIVLAASFLSYSFQNPTKHLKSIAIISVVFSILLLLFRYFFKSKLKPGVVDHTHEFDGTVDYEETDDEETDDEGDADADDEETDDEDEETDADDEDEDGSAVMEN
tara:strand:+ start:315 stop:776 length:462 start_codon:yes stop_codon:yes gene_type:complete